MITVLPCVLETGRLVLRPTAMTDVERAFEIRQDPEVSRMLSMATFPPDRGEIAEWFAIHPQEWVSRKAFRFSINLQGRMIGIVDIDGISERRGTLGYWLDRACWGHGYAFEGASAVRDFAFDKTGLEELRAGHAFDNPASGRILGKLGFIPVDRVTRFSRSRGQEITQYRYLLVKSGTTAEARAIGGTD